MPAPSAWFCKLALSAIAFAYAASGPQVLLPKLATPEGATGAPQRAVTDVVMRFHDEGRVEYGTFIR
jgi:hypothetical protein